MQINVNLATRYYFDKRKLNIVSAAAGAMLLLLLVVLIGVAVANLGEIRRLKAEQAKLEARNGRPGVAVSEKDYQAVVARIGSVNSIIDKKAVNWLQLLDRLEEVVPDGIAVTLIEPDLKTRGLKIGGAARNFAAIRLLLENLERSPHFPDVLLLSHKELKVTERQLGFSFEISTRLVW
jgi:type IV pilus assembly protein PilN